jgi:DNA replication licensing factor MCM7
LIICARKIADPLLQYEKALGEEADSLKLVSSIEKNALHYIEIISRAVDACLPPAQEDIRFALIF